MTSLKPSEIHADSLVPRQMVDELKAELKFQKDLVSTLQLKVKEANKNYEKEKLAHCDTLKERDLYKKKYKDGKKKVKEITQNNEKQLEVTEHDLKDAKDKVFEYSEKLKSVLAEKERNNTESEERVARRDRKIEKIKAKL